MKDSCRNLMRKRGCTHGFREKMGGVGGLGVSVKPFGEQEFPVVEGNIGGLSKTSFESLAIAYIQMQGTFVFIRFPNRC